jgi:Nuclear condensing complex subunits, C-term domain
MNALRFAGDTENDMIDSILEIIRKINNWRTGEDQVEADAEEDCIHTMGLVRILSILTVFLETASSKLSSNPAVKDFAKYIIPSVTHKDPMVREAAMGCFGKLGLFTDENTLIAEFKPILLEVASCEDEKIEIRAQALLALADWSVLFSQTLATCKTGSKTIALPDIVRDMMDDSRISAVCISAEVAAKLLFSGRVCESEWFAKLITIFFDSRILDMDDDGGNIKEVGSPVRLQQLLTLFFPAICLKDDADSRDALMGCILPLLELVYLKAKSQKRKLPGLLPK